MWCSSLGLKWYVSVLIPSTSTLVTYTALHPVTIPECKIHTDECLLHSNFPIKYEAAVSIKNKEGYAGNLKKKYK